MSQAIFSLSGDFWIKAGETQRRSIIVERRGADTRPGTNVERNPSGSFSHRTQRYCTWWCSGRGAGRGTNGDQRSAVYVMLARETRRPMTDLEGGGGGAGLLGVIKRLLRL